MIYLGTYSTLKFRYHRYLLNTQIWEPTQHSKLGTSSTLKFGFPYLLNTQIWVPTQHSNLGTYSTLEIGHPYLLNTQIWVPVPTQLLNLGTYSTLKFEYYLLNTQIWIPTQHSNLGTCTYSTLKFGYLLNPQLLTVKNSHRWSWIAKPLGLSMNAWNGLRPGTNQPVVWVCGGEERVVARPQAVCLFITALIRTVQYMGTAPLPRSY